MEINKDYAAYLQTRSFIGLLYRRFFLYPRLSKLLKGYLLDVGCGIGDMLAHYPNSVGVDVNSANVDYCRSRGLSSFVMPLDHIPFGDNSFDSVLLDNVLEHIALPCSILKEVRRVLRPGGVLLVGVPGLKGMMSDPDHKVFYDEQHLSQLATFNNFEVDQFFYMPLFKSKWLSKNVRQYCIYSVWVKN